MKRNVKQAIFVVVGVVLISTALLTWASIRRKSALSDAQLSRPAEIEAPTTYSWIDRDHGIAAIPVSRAMDIIGEKGLPWGLVPEEPKPPVVSPADSAAADTAATPLKSTAPKLDPERVQAGQVVFAKRCQGCHAEGTKYPPLANRYGTKVELEGGGQAVFDEPYIRESITNPGAKIAATYKVMPTLPNLTDDDVQNLTVYIHSLTK